MVANKKNPKIMTEQQTRQHLIDLGSKWGFSGEIQQIFHKYDRLLQNCTNLQEKKAIQTFALLEINTLLGGGESRLMGNGEVLIDNLKKPAEEITKAVTDTNNSLQDKDLAKDQVKTKDQVKG